GIEAAFSRLVLRVDISPGGGLLEPIERLGIVLIDPLPVLVANPALRHPLGIALLRRLLIERGGFLLLGGSSFNEFPRQRQLRLKISGLGGFAPTLISRVLVLLDAAPRLASLR